MSVYPIKPIGYLTSCFKEKFGIPRQSGLIDEVEGIIEFSDSYNMNGITSSLENFSHIWVLFIFDQSISQNFSPTVRPPRLGGNKRVGVFASRSPNRPNPIGLSLVKLLKITNINGRQRLHISGHDLVDKTPIVDIKPYIPEYDSRPNAQSGWTEDIIPHKLQVIFSDNALKKISNHNNPKLKIVIEKLLELDPRPSYKRKKEEDRIYAMKLYDFDLKWKVENQILTVLDLADLS